MTSITDATALTPLAAGVPAACACGRTVATPASTRITAPNPLARTPCGRVVQRMTSAPVMLLAASASLPPRRGVAGHGDPERAARRARCLERQPSAVRLHRTFCNRQAESGAADAVAFVGPVEALENPSPCLRGNAGAAVDHVEDRGRNRLGDADAHVAAARRELDRVVHEVDERVPQHLLVGERVRGGAPLHHNLLLL